MTAAQGILQNLSYVSEVTWGTTPATPQMINVPMVSTTLDYARDVINDATILPNRMEVNEPLGNAHVAGNVVVTSNHGQFDDWIEMALGGTWTTNVVKVGTTARSMTMEQFYNDITQARRFSGVRVNTWEVNSTLNAPVQWTFGVMGKTMATSQTALDATPTAVLNKGAQIGIGGTITIGGSAVTVTSFTMTHNNNMQGLFGLTSSSAAAVNWAEANTTGSVVLYFEDLVNYNRFLNETTAALVYQTTDGTNTITYTIPKAKFQTGAIPTPGAGALFLTMNFKALYDSSSGTTISVTRS